MIKGFCGQREEVFSISMEVNKVAEDGEKKKFPMVMVVILIVVGLVLAGGVSYFIATKVMSDNSAKMNTREPGIFVKLGDSKDGIIVNVGGVKSGRFLKVGIVLEMNPGKSKNFADGKLLPSTETKILDTVLQILRSQKVEDFDPSKQENLKTVVKEEVNKEIGENSVFEVFITNFVLQ